MTTQADRYVIIGKLGAPYGTKGWIKLLSFTETMDKILDFNPWCIEEKDNHWKAFDIQYGRKHGKGLVVKLSGIDNPEQARLLNGKKIAVLRAQLPKLKEGEYYWDDLQGLTVINQQGQTLGKVIYLIATGANDVLVVKGVKEYAIPYLPHTVVTKIDLNQRIMIVCWDDI